MDILTVCTSYQEISIMDGFNVNIMSPDRLMNVRSICNVLNVQFEMPHDYCTSC